MNNPIEDRLSEALHDITSHQPFFPDVTAIVAHSRRRHRRARMTRAAVGFGVGATVAAVTIAATTAGTGHSQHITSVATGNGPTPATTAPGAGGPLTVLADTINASDTAPAGDSTLVVRNQSYPGKATIVGYDLYTDSGKYYYSPTKAGLPAQVTTDNNQGDGVFAREIAAAKFAATGDLTTARQQMANAPLQPGTTVPTTVAQSAAQIAAAAAAKAKATGEPSDVVSGPNARTDNWVWEDSLDALTAGAGNPQVRAGVLRLISTIPNVKVVSGTTDGQPSLTLTAGAPALMNDYQESLTINSQSGVPLSFAGGAPGQTPSVSITYQVQRETLADVAAGKF